MILRELKVMDLKSKHLPFFYYREEILSKISNLEINLCYLSNLKKKSPSTMNFLEWLDWEMVNSPCSVLYNEMWKESMVSGEHSCDEPEQ